MATNDAGTALHRLLCLWQLLPEKGLGISASEVASKLADEGFDIESRTVQRDLIKLQERRLAISTAQGRKFLWLRNNPVRTMTPADALTLMLFEPMLAVMPQQMKHGLLDRLSHAKDLLNKEKIRYSDKIACYAGDSLYHPPKVDETLLLVIQEALIRDSWIEVSYQATQQQPKIYLLAPLALVLRGRVLYLVAIEREENGNCASSPSQPARLFAIHRFHEVNRCYEHFQRPSNFSLSDYLDSGSMQFSDGKQVLLEALISPQLAFYLAETPLSDDQTLSLSNDGKWHLSATVFDGWQLKWWIKGQGANIQVLSPEPLRTSMISSLEKALAAYRQSNR